MSRIFKKGKNFWIDFCDAEGRRHLPVHRDQPESGRRMPALGLDQNHKARMARPGRPSANIVRQLRQDLVGARMPTLGARTA